MSGAGPLPDEDARRELAAFARFTAGTALGEAAGLAVTAAVGAAAARVAPTAPPAVVLGLMALAGLAEGACLGLGQALALRGALGAAAPRWVLATAVGVLAAWLLGMGRSAFEPSEAAGPRELATLAAAFGLVVGASLGVAQRVVWRSLGRDAAGWVLASALAWALAMGFSSALTWAAPAGGGPLEAVAWNALHGLATGLVAGAAQALAARRLLRTRAD